MTKPKLKTLRKIIQRADDAEHADSRPPEVDSLCPYGAGARF